jgi:hypothetical protein
MEYAVFHQHRTEAQDKSPFLGNLDGRVNHLPPDVILPHFSLPFASWRLCARHSELLSPLALPGLNEN